MSRSIGDWDAGKLGVIPDPIVKVLDIDAVVDWARRDDPNMPSMDGDEFSLGTTSVVVDERSDVSAEGSRDLGLDDVHVFAVSATDGTYELLDWRVCRRFW
jgi:hypothetical protein